MSDYDGDSMITNNLRDSVNGTFVTLDDSPHFTWNEEGTIVAKAGLGRAHPRVGAERTIDGLKEAAIRATVTVCCSHARIWPGWYRGLKVLIERWFKRKSEREFLPNPQAAGKGRLVGS